MLRRDLELLSFRVALLEEEHVKTTQAITELSSCLQNIAALVSDLSVDVNAFGLYLRAQIEQDQVDFERGQMFPFPDDDGGYLN